MKLIAKLAAVAAASAALSMWEPAPAGAEDSESETTIPGHLDPRTAVRHSRIPRNVHRRGQRPAPVRSRTVSAPPDAAEVTFSPFARTAWHTHPGGQTLIVTSGEGWVQQWGGPKQVIKPGDVIWIPPDGQTLARRDRRHEHDPHRRPGLRRRSAPSTGWSWSPTSQYLS